MLVRATALPFREAGDNGQRASRKGPGGRVSLLSHHSPFAKDMSIAAVMHHHVFSLDQPRGLIDLQVSGPGETAICRGCFHLNKPRNNKSPRSKCQRYTRFHHHFPILTQMLADLEKIPPLTEEGALRRRDVVRSALPHLKCTPQHALSGDELDRAVDWVETQLQGGSGAVSTRREKKKAMRQEKEMATMSNRDTGAMPSPDSLLGAIIFAHPSAEIFMSTPVSSLPTSSITTSMSSTTPASNNATNQSGEVAMNTSMSSFNDLSAAAVTPGSSDFEREPAPFPSSEIDLWSSTWASTSDFQHQDCQNFDFQDFDAQNLDFQPVDFEHLDFQTSGLSHDSPHAVLQPGHLDSPFSTPLLCSEFPTEAVSDDAQLGTRKSPCSTLLQASAVLQAVIDHRLPTPSTTTAGTISPGTQDYQPQALPSPLAAPVFSPAPVTPCPTPAHTSSPLLHHTPSCNVDLTLFLNPAVLEEAAEV